MAKVKLTLLAEGDLVDIARYTRRKWGVKQRDKYLRTLKQRFRRVAEAPKAAPLRDDIAPGCRLIMEGNHRILYQEIPGGILILRVLHYAREIPSM